MSSNEGIAPNANRLLWAGFMAILAAGVGFAIRGGIFANWGAEFGFTGGELGSIGAMGFIGFCFGIIIGGIVALAAVVFILSGGELGGKKTVEGDQDLPPIATADR